MIVWGGGLKSFDFDAPVDTGGIYTPSTDSWTPTTTTNAPVQRMVPTAVWTGDVMIVWGGHFGIDEGGCCIGYYNSGGRYDPATDAWTPTSRQDGPEGHWGHTAVWTGSRMIVWGGRKGPNLDVDTGARYDPVSDSWTPTSTLGTPLRRALHAGVWTGDEMIVWGGVTPDIIGEVPTNTGARYDPLTDSWTPTPTAGAPLPRARSTAVWTGQEMIVWGGLGIGHLQLNTGGRYDPASNAWTRTSTTSAPTGRAQHTVAWTGKEMIVWGGFTPTATNSGGRYDPLTDSWIPTPVALAPAARGAHTAVWTGNEMIVWGGLDVDLMNTGGRYDTTLLDGWTEPPSSIDAPAPRALHTAVWTGNEMIVWGGIVGDLGPVPPSVTNTGGRYEADADAWVPTSTIAAPKATASHSAMWTGSTMIVWGGSVTGSSGGRYVANLSTDADLDGFCDYLDCDDSNDQVWATPGEALDLVFVDDLTLSWNVPSTPGGLSLVYDTLRSTDASDFVTGSDCLEQDDGSDTEALDADAPVSGGVFYYLIRAENACPFGLGSMGASSDDSPRTGRSCP